VGQETLGRGCGHVGEMGDRLGALIMNNYRG